MTEQDVFNKLKTDYPNQISDIYPFPKTFLGSAKIKAIVLGADPTNIVNDAPKQLEMVFGLEQPKSPYWHSIKKNLNELKLPKDNIYVQNLCRNYFRKETSENKIWNTVARNYWAPFLRKELSELFSPEIPILMTTEFILHAVLLDPKKRIKAKTIYTDKIIIPKEENLLGRELIAFYRHHAYSLSRWENYKNFIKSKIVI